MGAIAPIDDLLRRAESSPDLVVFAVPLLM
jgi:hypothetical protein